jgi:hypothetical protein
MHLTSYPRDMFVAVEAGVVLDVVSLLLFEYLVHRPASQSLEQLRVRNRHLLHAQGDDIAHGKAEYEFVMENRRPSVSGVRKRNILYAGEPK